MLNRLKFKHPSDFSEITEKSKQSLMNEFVNSPKSQRFSSSQSELINNAIVDIWSYWITWRYIVEGRGFTKLMTIFIPEFKIPSRNTIKSQIEKVYCDKKENLITETNLNLVILLLRLHKYLLLIYYPCMTEKAFIQPVNRLIGRKMNRVTS